MPRHSREQSGTGIYHVMLRGVNRQSIFEDDEDNIRFISLLRNLVERFDDAGKPLPALCTFYAYCLMDNHVHLLVKEQSEKNSTIIKRLAVSYAYYFNRKYSHNGHLFQDRFKSEPVNDLAYFMTLMRYIHQNPVKAGMVSDVRDYRWSSWHEYASASLSLPPICTVQSVFKRIKRQDLLEQISAPLELFDDPLDKDEEKTVSRSVSDSEARELLRQFCGLSNICEIQTFERKDRNEILEVALINGVGVRQLARLTGVSYGIIQRLNEKMGQRMK
jgi:REP element-mobilizing transposase RayT